MYRKYVYGGTVWYDFRETSAHEVQEVASFYGLQDVDIKFLLNPKEEPHTEQSSKAMLVSLLLPCCMDTPQSHEIAAKTINFAIGRNYIITVRFEDIRGFKKLKKIEKKKGLVTSPLALAASLIHQVHHTTKDDVSKNLATISRKVSSKEAYPNFLLEYSRRIAANEKVLEAFRALALEFFVDSDSNDDFASIMKDYRELIDKIESQQQTQIDHLIPVEKTTLLESIRRMFKRN